MPQVRVAFTGIAIYTWDVAFRAATVVGFFGGGGMGWYLKRNVQQLENLRVGAIILSIIAMVLAAEFISSWLRETVNRSKQLLQKQIFYDFDELVPSDTGGVPK